MDCRSKDPHPPLYPIFGEDPGEDPSRMRTLGYIHFLSKLGGKTSCGKT